MKYHAYIGRWQSPHMGHRWLIDQHLDKGEPVLGVTWVDISNNVQLGVAYQFQKNDSGDVVEVVVDTLWDVREK